MFFKTYISPKTARRIFLTVRCFSSHAHNTELENLRYLSRALWALGEERSITGKTMTNLYRHFREEQQVKLSVAPTQNLEDWTQIDQIIREFGIPEMADHISGAFYRFANIEEDRCSQCIRIADSVSKFSIDELKHCLNTMAWWSSEVENSSSVRDIVKQLDLTCIDRLASLHFSLEDQLRVGFQWETLWFSCSCSFPSHMLVSLSSTLSTVPQPQLPVLVSFLLLAAFTKPQSNLHLDTEALEDKLLVGEHELVPAQAELVAAYMGLKQLNQGEHPTKLKRHLEQNFGLRLG